MTDEESKRYRLEMLNALIQGNEQQASLDFHNYATGKLQNLLNINHTDDVDDDLTEDAKY